MSIVKSATADNTVGKSGSISRHGGFRASSFGLVLQRLVAGKYGTRCILIVIESLKR